MPLFNNRLANEAVAIAGAIAVGVLLDLLLPGGSIVSGIGNMTWEKVKYIGIGLVVLVIFVIIVGIWAIKRSEKVWKFDQIKDRYWMVLRNKLWSGILSKILNRTTAGKNVWLKRRLEPDRLPAILRENIIILFSLSNYLKRLYIMYRKKGQVASAEEVIQKMYGPIGHRMDIKELEYEIYGLRNGSGPKVTTNSEGQPISWFGGYEEYCKVLDKVADLVKEYIISIQNRREGEWPSFGSRAINLVQEVNGAATNIVEAYNLLRVVGRAYGAHQP